MVHNLIVAVKCSFYYGLRFLMCVVCVKCSCSSHGPGSSSCVAQQELHVMIVKVFLVSEQFAYPRPIQDYGTGPGTPLACR